MLRFYLTHELGHWCGEWAFFSPFPVVGTRVAVLQHLHMLFTQLDKISRMYYREDSGTLQQILTVSCLEEDECVRAVLGCTLCRLENVIVFVVLPCLYYASVRKYLSL